MPAACERRRQGIETDLSYGFFGCLESRYTSGTLLPTAEKSIVKEQVPAALVLADACSSPFGLGRGEGLEDESAAFVIGILPRTQRWVRATGRSQQPMTADPVAGWQVAFRHPKEKGRPEGQPFFLFTTISSEYHSQSINYANFLCEIGRASCRERVSSPV